MFVERVFAKRIRPQIYKISKDNTDLLHAQVFDFKCDLTRITIIFVNYNNKIIFFFNFDTIKFIFNFYEYIIISYFIYTLSNLIYIIFKLQILIKLTLYKYTLKNSIEYHKFVC